MIPYATLSAAEAALNWTLSYPETLWYNYSSAMPDVLLYYHNLAFLFLVFTLVLLPIALIELWFPNTVKPYKIQPRVSLKPVSFVKCYLDVLKVFVLVIGPLQLSSYPIIKTRIRCRM